MTDTRTCTTTRTTRYDADSDVDSVQMTHYDPYAEMHAQNAAHAVTRQQLAEAMSLVADIQTALNLSEHLRQEQATELEAWKAETSDHRLRDAWRREAMESRRERAQLVAERDEATAQAEIYRKERDAQRRIWLKDSATLADERKTHAVYIEAWKDEERMWRDADRTQLAQIARITAERDAARRTADEAVDALSVIRARFNGMGWWC